ncbi:MAG: magnesium transporter CorA family protein [Spirochaetales bacterium]|nr:magnesium transporter CorA family protein [Spirochaetales bacterium]
MITVRHNTKTDGYIWVDARDVNREDMSVLTEEYGISSELLADIMDIDEQARIEKEDDYTALIMRLPSKSDDESEITQTCVPLGVILFPKQVITICQGDSIVLEDFAKARFRQYPVDTKEGFVISILGRSALVYIRLLKYINRQKDLIEEQLHKSIMNYELIQLLSIQKSLVYFTTSLSSNEMLLEKLQKTIYFKLNNEEEEEFLDDVITDNKQAISMANIYSDILTGTMDAFASVIGNNMNVIMKRLTVISLSLMFPTFITGFFGMNVPLPGTHWPFMWIVLTIACVLVAVLGAYFLSNRRSRMFIKQTIGEGKKQKKRNKRKAI